jgi:iron complex outermembrane recepter protein
MHKIISLIFLLLPFIAFSQGTLKGRVTERSTGDPLIGVTLYFPELKTGTTTDTLGNYSIGHLPGANVLIQVSYVGFKTILRRVDPDGSKTLDFAMESSVNEMKEIVITGSPAPTEANRNPVPIITLNRISMDRNLSTNIIDAITKLPGVSEVTTGPNVSKPFIRGLGYNRILTLYDDVRLEGQQWGDEHGIEVDPYSIERAEVVKGPASLTYGSDALAGVVNLLPFAPITHDGIKAGILAEYQSNNGMFGMSVPVNGREKDWIWGVRLSHRHGRNYKDPVDGRVYNTGFSESDAGAYAGVNKKWGYSRLNFALYDDLQEIPDGSRDSVTRKFTKQITDSDTVRLIVSNDELNTYKISVIHQHVQHYYLFSTNEFQLGKDILEFVLGYQASIRREYSHPQAPDTPGLYLLLNTESYNIHYHMHEIGGWKISAGLNGMYQNNRNKGTEFIIPDYSQTDVGPFLYVTKTAGKFDLAGGIRYDLRFFSNDEMYTRTDPVTGFDMQVSPPDTAGASHTFTRYAHTFGGLSAALGSTWNLSDNFYVKANVARGYRAPNISEISANGVHPGTGMYQIGNSSFKPEFSMQEDLGLFFIYANISASVEGFVNSISNYIFNQKLLNAEGGDSIIVKGNQTFEYRQSTALLYGGEATLNIHPKAAGWLHLDNSVSTIYALNKGGDGVQITDSSKYLPQIPPLHFRTELRAEFRKWGKHLSSLYAKIGMDCYAMQDRVYLEANTETPTPSYTLFDAGVGGNVTCQTGKTICSIRFSGSNIFDIAYQSHLSRLKYMEQYPLNGSGRSGIYDMGRNIGVELEFPLGSRN